MVSQNNRHVFCKSNFSTIFSLDVVSSSQILQYVCPIISCSHSCGYTDILPAPITGWDVSVKYSICWKSQMETNYLFVFHGLSIKNIPLLLFLLLIYCLIPERSSPLCPHPPPHTTHLGHIWLLDLSCCACLHIMMVKMQKHQSKDTTETAGFISYPVEGQRADPTAQKTHQTGSLPSLEFSHQWA